MFIDILKEYSLTFLGKIKNTWQVDKGGWSVTECLPSPHPLIFKNENVFMFSCNIY